MVRLAQRWMHWLLVAWLTAGCAVAPPPPTPPPAGQPGPAPAPSAPHPDPCTPEERTRPPQIGEIDYGPSRLQSYGHERLLLLPAQARISVSVAHAGEIQWRLIPREAGGPGEPVAILQPEFDPVTGRWVLDLDVPTEPLYLTLYAEVLPCAPSQPHFYHDGTRRWAVRGHLVLREGS